MTEPLPRRPFSTFPINQLPSDLFLYLSDYLTSTCSPSILLNLMLVSPEMHHTFSRGLYRTIAMNGENARKICYGIDPDLDKHFECQHREIEDKDTVVQAKGNIWTKIKRPFKTKQRAEVLPTIKPCPLKSSPIPFQAEPTPFSLDSLSIHHRKIGLLNHIKFLTLNDLESAVYVAHYLHEEVLQLATSKSYPPVKPFQNVENLTFGIELMQAKVDFIPGGGSIFKFDPNPNNYLSSFPHLNPHGTLNTLSHNLKPKNVCSNWISGLEKPFDLIFFQKLGNLVGSWNLESFTWHSNKGRIVPYPGEGMNLLSAEKSVTSFFPRNVPLIRAFNHEFLTEDCIGIQDEFVCECGKALKEILIYLNLENWSDEIINRNRRVELIGYPCLIGIGIGDIMKSVKQGQKFLGKSAIEVEQARIDWSNRQEWLRDNFKIFEMGGAEDCKCCGNK